MAYEIIIRKRFALKLSSLLEYLEKEWGIDIAQAFLAKIYTRIDALQSHPEIGSPTSLKNVRSTSITKHNRLYYRVVGKKIEILNLYDTRKKKPRA